MHIKYAYAFLKWQLLKMISLSPFIAVCAKLQRCALKRGVAGHFGKVVLVFPRMVSATITRLHFPFHSNGNRPSRTPQVLYFQSNRIPAKLQDTHKETIRFILTLPMSLVDYNDTSDIGKKTFPIKLRPLSKEWSSRSQDQTFLKSFHVCSWI